MEIERIKFATSVQINATEKMFVDATKDKCKILFNSDQGVYVIEDRYTRTIFVHTANVQWSTPKQQPEIEESVSYGSEETVIRRRGRPRVNSAEQA